MRLWAGRVVGVIAISALALAACSSGTKHPATASSSSTVTTPASTRPRARLAFRPVTEQLPITMAVCHRKNPAILPARDGKSCYIVGPLLLTGAGIASAAVVYDSGNSQWATDVHFDNNDFVTTIAGPELNKTIAIVLNGVVQSAPVVNPGITGRDVEISGNYTQAEATSIAASIMGVAPSQIHS